MLKSLVVECKKILINKNEKGWNLMEITNAKSKVALILAIVSLIIPIIGLILATISIVISNQSLKEIEKFNQKGKGLARSAKIISIVYIFIDGLALLVGLIAICVNFFTK
ncbi:hypothetical protein COJ46_01410 [Bacillus sp. AFS077874]|nr:hypothetical protein COJ46_01410 [Bacillus sp. AFS077874]